MDFEGGIWDNNFNPRSREGSDKVRIQRQWLRENFNPRSREGSDQVNSRIYGSFYISIRAPARGATQSKYHYQHYK